jgi:protein-export membrane protein SecD
MLHFSRVKIIMILLAILAGMVFTSPNFFTKDQLKSWPDVFPKGQMALGLDLQGGAHLVLQIDTPSLVKERLDALRDSVRRTLRDEKIGYTGGIGIRDKSVIVRITDAANVAKAEEKLKTLIQQIGGGLLGGASVLDLTVERASGGEGVDANAITLTLTDEGIDARARQAVDQSIEVVRRRIDALGTTEPLITKQGANRLLVEVPGFSDTEYLKNILKQTAKMTFHMVVAHHDAALSADRGADTELYYTRENKATGEGKVPVLVEKVPLLTGADLVDSQPTFDQGHEPVVSFRFNTSGAKKFADITQANVGKLFAIVLDKEVITYPRINGPIPGGSGIITGNFSVQSASDLALLLRAGSLPAGLTVVEERTVGPGLGADSIAAGKKAAIIGVAGVALYMFLNYGLFGMFANVAVVINVMFTFAILSAFGATLTLPGIAGIVLGVGMAVDANVLIYERIREEQLLGMSPVKAIDEGFKRAIATIFDANSTHVIAALVLFYFGTGPIKGFALTLIVGTLTSYFTAVTISRLFVTQWLRFARPTRVPL